MLGNLQWINMWQNACFLVYLHESTGPLMISVYSWNWCFWSYVCIYSYSLINQDNKTIECILNLTYFSSFKILYLLCNHITIFWVSKTNRLYFMIFITFASEHKVLWRYSNFPLDLSNVQTKLDKETEKSHWGLSYLVNPWIKCKNIRNVTLD